MEEQERPHPSRPMAAGWNPDPYGRHELRYWDGGQWTGHVSDGGRAGLEWADVPASADSASASASAADVAAAAGATLAPAGAMAGGPAYGSRRNATPKWATTRSGLAPLPGRPPPSPHFSGPRESVPMLAGSPIGRAKSSWYKARWLWVLITLGALAVAGVFVATLVGESDENAGISAAPGAPAPEGYRMIQTESYEFAVPEPWTYERLATGVMETGTDKAVDPDSARGLTVATDPVTRETVSLVPYHGVSGDPGEKAQLAGFEADFRKGVAPAEVIELSTQPFLVHGLPAGKLIASLAGPEGLSTVVSTVIRTDRGLFQLTVTARSAERATVLDTLVLPTFAPAARR